MTLIPNFFRSLIPDRPKLARALSALTIAALATVVAVCGTGCAGYVPAEDLAPEVERGAAIALTIVEVLDCCEALSADDPARLSLIREASAHAAELARLYDEAGAPAWVSNLLRLVTQMGALAGVVVEAEPPPITTEPLADHPAPLMAPSDEDSDSGAGDAD